MSQLIRLNKFIADCGISSRRKADELIENGSVSVNGKKILEHGLKVDPVRDKVTVKGKRAFLTGAYVYYMLNKPEGILTSMSDPDDRPTIADLTKRIRTRIFPVGRLDWDSEGLLLLTNDGEFAQNIMHPKEEIPKTYLVKLSGQPTEAQLNRLIKGVSIVGGRVKATSIERVKKGSNKYDWIKIVVTEGKNRQVRKMFEKIGHDVKKLRRIAIGRLTLQGVKKGEYLKLNAEQLYKVFDPIRETVKTHERGRATAKTTTTRKSAPTGKTTSTRKATASGKPTSSRKPTTGRKPASAGKSSSARKPGPARKTSSARKTKTTGRAGKRA